MFKFVFPCGLDQVLSQPNLRCILRGSIPQPAPSFPQARLTVFFDIVSPPAIILTSTVHILNFVLHLVPPSFRYQKGVGGLRPHPVVSLALHMLSAMLPLIAILPRGRRSASRLLVSISDVEHFLI